MLFDKNDPVVIVGAKRTPCAALLGDFKDMAAPNLGAIAIEAAVFHAGLTEHDIEEVLMGCVLPAGQGQAPARQAAIGAGLSKSIPCTTINKMCGSGMKAVMMLAESIAVGSVKAGVAGGMESMSNAPYLLPKARSGIRLGHAEMKDSMFLDGLEDAYEGGLMGSFAELCADKYQFTRKAQDDYALASLERALSAEKAGIFETEIAAVTITSRKGEMLIDKDEQPGKARPEKIPHLKPAFRKEGTVTAANASSISDGAAALVMMKASSAREKGLKPLAKIIGQTQYASEPAWFTTAPVGAMQTLFDEMSVTASDIDLFEINEAFAVVPMAAMQDLSIPHERLNIYGGACALGHPIGASGARIIVTLMNALQRQGKKTGVASLCIGGGEATAVALELV